MKNTEISNNDPEKVLIEDKSISNNKAKEISKKNTTQNKKITPKNDKSTNLLMKFLMKFLEISFLKKTL